MFIHASMCLARQSRSQNINLAHNETHVGSWYTPEHVVNCTCIDAKNSTELNSAFCQDVKIVCFSPFRHGMHIVVHFVQARAVKSCEDEIRFHFILDKYLFY